MVFDDVFEFIVSSIECNICEFEGVLIWVIVFVLLNKILIDKVLVEIVFCDLIVDVNIM